MGAQYGGKNGTELSNVGLFRYGTGSDGQSDKLGATGGRNSFGGLSEVCNGGLGAKDLDKLFLVDVDASLHDVHTWAEDTLKRSHVQDYRHRQTHIQKHRQTDRYRQTYRHT